MDKKDELFLENIDLVDRIINKLYYYNYLRDDLRQVALMGLFKAVNKYNDEYGVLFSTYASYFIIGEIKRELRNNKLIKTGKKVTKVITLLQDNYTLKEIKEVTGFADDIIYTGLMYKDNIKSCEVESIDLIKSSSNDSFLNDLEIILKGDLLKVIKLKYVKNLSQKEISEIMNISQASVSRIEKKALEILRKSY